MLTDNQIADRHREIRNSKINSKIKDWAKNKFMTPVDIEEIYDNILLKMFVAKVKPTFENTAKLDTYISMALRNNIRKWFYTNKNHRTPPISQSTLNKNYELARNIINNARSKNIQL